jgi:hypothetical protein
MSTTALKNSLSAGRGTGQQKRTSSRRPFITLRMKVLTHRWSLDGRLADGEPPESDEALMLRAHQLTTGRSRRRLARSLMRAVEDTRQSRVMTSAARLDRPAVAAARQQLFGLAARLEGREPVGARGAAMITVLLCDGSSPFYSPAVGYERSGLELSDRLHAAAVALDELR